MEGVAVGGDVQVGDVGQDEGVRVGVGMIWGHLDVVAEKILLARRQEMGNVAAILTR
jgi:hypothetical protein